MAVNRTVPPGPPPSPTPHFSAEPTDLEITRARVFAEALVPVGPTSAAENRALAAAVVTYRESRDPEVARFEAFLEAFPASAWRPALLVNLGREARARGAFSRALSLWEEAWRQTKDDPSRAARTVADDALGEALAFSADLGHVALLERWLTEAGDRVPQGLAGERLWQAKGTLGALRQSHGRLVSCGRAALGLLWAAERTTPVPVALQRPGEHDTTLAELQTLATQVGLGTLRAVQKAPAAAPVTPSLVHLRLGHYAVLVRTDGERYLMRDPALGTDLWVTRAALDEELSGYMLVSGEADRPGLRPVDAAEAATVVGRSACPSGPPNRNTRPCNGGAAGPSGGPSGGGNRGGGCTGSCASKGMPTPYIGESNASLWLTDTPVGYTPARGPAVPFTIRYHSQQRLHPQTPVYGWLGPQWTHDWLSYAAEIPAYCESGITNFCYTAAVFVHLRGGGLEEVYSLPDGTYPRHWQSQAQLVRVSADPIRYERRLASGEVEVYAIADTAPAGSRRVFLSEVRDAQGQAVTLTYDSQYRLTALTDAVGQVTTLSYADAADPLHLTGITDPFGRTATLAYDGTGQVMSITDAVGLSTRFVYDAGGQIVLFATPYGSWTVRQGNDYFNPWLELTDPEGGVERVEYRWTTTAWAASEPAAEVPEGFATGNRSLNDWTTVHWSPSAWALGPGNVANATLTRWLGAARAPGQQFLVEPLPHSVKRPLERRVWYRYPGQGDPFGVGTSVEPSVVARVLDDGTTQQALASYNVQGMVTSRTDAAGRQTTYVYYDNGVDLHEVRQITPGGYDVVAHFGDYTTGHQPLTVTDAAGQTTTLTYTTAGQVQTSTNAKSETTTYAYDTVGRLESVTGPMTGATTTYAYTDYNPAVGYSQTTVTGPDGYAATIRSDALDRPTRVTYPDGTYEETTYDRLDVRTRRDRLGRVTQHVYDALRRLRATRDPAGRTVTQEWNADGLGRLVDAKGQATRWVRDVQGRVTQEVRADDTTTTTYTYEAASGRLHTVTDPKGQVTTYSYNLDDSVSGITYTNAQIATPGVSYTYEAVYNRVLTMVDGTGTTAYTYHPAGSLGAGQVWTVDGPLTDDTITYTYDELGRVVSRAINGTANTTTQVYDALGRVTSETNVLGTFTYGYVGATGRLETVTYPNGQTSSYSYFNTLGDLRLQTIHHRKPDTSTLSRFDYTYDVAGNILTWQQQADSDAPTLWKYGYDRADQLTAAVHQTTGTTPTIIKRYGFSYDPAGNRTSEQIDDAVTVDTHDSLNRLLTKSAGGVLTFSGTLNEPGRVTINGKPAPVDATTNAFSTGVPVIAGTTTVTINAVDASGNAAEAVYEVDQAGTGKTFTYDANGNMMSDGTRTFEWDARNQLLAVNVGTHRSEFVYDGLQRRVREIEKENGVVQTDTRVVWCNSAICEERAADGMTVTSRAFQHGEQAGGQVRHFVLDHLGSVREVTDATSALLGRYAFDPWGRRTPIAGSEVTRTGFTGHRSHDASGLVLSLHRAYDADAARWLTEDPAGTSDGVNRFTYVRGRTVAWWDPLGLAAEASSCCTDLQKRRQRIHDILDGLGQGNKPAGKVWGSTYCYEFRAGGQVVYDAESVLDPSVPRCLADCVRMHEERHAGQCRRHGGSYMESPQAERAAYMVELGCVLLKLKKTSCCDMM